jgi:hypothetical protein
VMDQIRQELTRAKQDFAKARDAVAHQREIILCLEKERRDTSTAEDILRTLIETQVAPEEWRLNYAQELEEPSDEQGEQTPQFPGFYRSRSDPALPRACRFEVSAYISSLIGNFDGLWAGNSRPRHCTIFQSNDGGATVDPSNKILTQLPSSGMQVSDFYRQTVYDPNDRRR